MRKIKDFFYNKNDIIIVLLIVAAASFIIYTRIDAIMAYPETATQNAAQTADTSNRQNDMETGESSGADDTISSEDAETAGSNTTVNITIKDSDTAVSVSEKLAEAGLVSSAEEFESLISNKDKAESIKSGSFEIPSGSTDEEILYIITQ